MVPFSFLKNRSSRALFIANAVPLIGVLFFQWNVVSLLLSYWIESGVIGFYNVLKMSRAEGEIWVDKNNETHPSGTAGAVPITPAQMKATRFFLIPFFLFHYTGFMTGHYFFIVAILPTLIRNGQSSEVLLTTAFWPMIITGLSLLISHGISYYENFLGHEEYKSVEIGTQMFAPYKRIIVMHVTVILGSIFLAFFDYPPLVLVVLISLKMIIDYQFHMTTHPSLKKLFANVIS